MEAPIEIEFYYKQDEFIRGVRIAQLRHKFTWIYAAIILCPFIKGVYAVFVRNIITGSTVFLVMFLPLFFLFQTVIVPNYLWHSRSSRHWKSKQYWQFSESGIEFANEDYESKFNWSMFSKLIETSEYFLIQYSTMSRFSVIPKRAFHSKDEMDTFVELFHQKVIPPKKRRW